MFGNVGYEEAKSRHKWSQPVADTINVRFIVRLMHKICDPFWFNESKNWNESIVESFN